MILIVGGEGSGKRDFVETLGYAEKDIANAKIDERPVVYHLEQLVFAQPEQADALLDRLLEKEIVICCEVGSGIIPVDRKERMGREATGRLCVRLAQQAQAVVRMVCGIPTVIKGELPGRR